MTYQDKLRQEAINRVVADVNSKVNSDGIVALDDLSNTTKNYFKKNSEKLNINKSKYEVDFVKEHTGYLLYVRKYNLADKLYQEAVSRGYLIDGVLDIKGYLTPKENESSADYALRHAKYRTWSRSIDDYMGQENITREQFFARYNVQVVVVDKYPKVFTGIYAVKQYINSFDDGHGCIDRLKQDDKCPALIRWCKRYYDRTDFEFLTPVQCLQKFVNDNTKLSFSKELYVPKDKLDIKVYNEYIDTKQQLYVFAGGGNITNLRKSEKELYNKVRHIKDIIGYETIKDCIDTMLYEYDIVYAPEGRPSKGVSLEKRCNTIRKRINELYAQGVGKTENVYRGKLLDISGISQYNRALYIMAQRAYRQYNFENHCNIKFSQFMKQEFKCYYPDIRANKQILKSNNVYHKGKTTSACYIATTPNSIIKVKKYKFDYIM